MVVHTVDVDGRTAPSGSVVAGPSRTATAALLVAALALTVVGALADPAGRVLAWPAAAALAALGLRDLLLGPAVRAGGAGLELVVGARRRWVPWSQVQGIRVVRDRRTALLELDLGDTLVLLSRLRLGRPAADVAAELSALQR